MTRRPPRSAVPVTALLTVLLLTGCGTDAAGSPDATGIALPPAGAGLDYQLGGAYPPPDGVGIVARDRTADPADGLYNVCYVNGFQTQPGEQDDWPADALLRDDRGAPVIDPAWPDEALLDTRRADLLAEVVGPWITGCAASGFDAVEFDNLDTYARSGGALTRDDAIALATRLVEIAHGAGLAAGQKNAAEDAALLRAEASFDFAVVEECAAYDECGAYTEVYGDHVLAIEYPDTLDRSFADVCADPATPASIVLRDRDLVTPDDPAYLFALCP